MRSISCVAEDSKEPRVAVFHDAFDLPTHADKPLFLGMIDWTEKITQSDVFSLFFFLGGASCWLESFSRGLPCWAHIARTVDVMSAHPSSDF